MKNKYYVGTRKSNLAVTQTKFVIELLKKEYPDIEFELIFIDTKGDKILDVSLSKIGDKGLFTKDLEDKILNREIDFAVHSLKDVSTVLPEGLIIGSICKRQDPRDIVIIKKDMIEKGFKTLSDLNNDTENEHVVGTSSIRRKAQLLNMYPNLKVKDLRGNIETRMNRLQDDDFGYSAIILAYSGLERVGDHYISKITEIVPDEFYYAASQGALCIECRENDDGVLQLIKSVSDERTTISCTQERELLRTLEVGCHAPLSVKTEFNEETNEFTINGRILSIDGKKTIEKSLTCSIDNFNKEIGKELGKKLLSDGGKELLSGIK